MRSLREAWGLRQAPFHETIVQRHRKRIPTIRDVGRLAGVAVSTASRVLSGRGYASDGARRRVTSAARRLDYTPQRAARLLRRGGGSVIGVLVPDLSHPLYVRWLRGAGEVARRHGYVLLICDGQGSAPLVEAQLGRLLEEGVDGLLIAGWIPRGKALQRFMSRGTPIGPHLPMPTPDLRLPNEVTATAEAFRHLVGLGHRRILLLLLTLHGVKGPTPLGKLRRRWLRRSLLEAGDSGCGMDVVTVYSREECAAAVEQRLRAAASPTAIVSGANVLTPAIVATANALGCTIPGDFSLLAFGESEWESACRPAISVVHHDYGAIAAALTDNLIARIEGRPDVPSVPPFPAEFVARASIAPPHSGR